MMWHVVKFLEKEKLDYEFNFIGRSKSYYSKLRNNSNLNFLGWISDFKLNEIINKTDFGYVPYSFDENFKNFTTTSFPNKVTTLTKKYIPIIAHSPSYSTLSKFVDKYKIGINLEKLNVEDLHNKIFILEKNIDKLYKNMKYINENLFDNNMIVDKYRKSFDE